MIIVPSAEPSNCELSDDEWARMVAPLRRSLHNEGLYSCTVINHGAELDAEKWCIMRESTIRDENNNDLPCGFRLVSPILPYYNLNSSDQYTRDLDIAFRVFNTYGCNPSSACSTRVHVTPAAPLAIFGAAVSAFTLDQAKDVTKTVPRYSGTLTNFVGILVKDCPPPWDPQVGTDISSAMERIDATQSCEDLAAYMSSRKQNDPNSAVPRCPMWDFSSLTGDTGTIQCSLGPCSKSGSDVATWVRFACLFVQGALLTKGNAVGDQVQDRTASYQDLHVFPRVQRQFYSKMVPGHVAGFDGDGGAWCNLLNLMLVRRVFDPLEEFIIRYEI
ncbi:hypothetical protein F4782DRAFT_532359 [Xylaria castorea]|nr:hypothetical protein F4782DRAFT_532359 [Xylaria castorea]